MIHLSQAFLRPRAVLLAVAFAVAACTVAGAILSAPPASAAEKYPSWGDVQDAKKDVGAKNAEISKITKLLDGLESRSAQLGDAAISQQADYEAAATKLQAASDKLADVQALLKSATEDSKALKSKVGKIAVRSYETGKADSSLNYLMYVNRSGGNFDQTQTLSMLADKDNSLLLRAQSAQKVEGSLSEEAAKAKTERASLADAAKKKYDATVAAQQAADAQIASSQKTNATLVSQLASLKDQSAETLKKYRAGVAAAKAYAAQQAAARAAAAKKAAAAARRHGGSGPTSGSGSRASWDFAPAAKGGGGYGSPSAARSYARSRLSAHGWGAGQYSCLVSLWNQESGWNMYADNPTSSAYGIPQSLPGSKMASAGADWRTNYRTQIDWGLGYIKSSYGSPCGAWSHEKGYNWY